MPLVSLTVLLMMIVAYGVTSRRCCMSVLLYFSILLWLFSAFHGFQSKHPSNEFVCTVRVWQRKLPRTLFEVESLEIWRQQYTTTSLSKKEKRKDRYNCMCVKYVG